MYPCPESGRLLTALLIAFALAGCREVPAPADSALTGFADEIVTQRDLVIPGTRWQEHGQGGWAFNNSASLLAWIHEAGDEALVVTLEPDRDTAAHHFEVRWDGVEVAADRIRRDEGGLRIELDPGQLAPGRHELALKRDYKSDARAHRRRHRNVFRQIGFSRGDERRRLAMEELDRYQLLARFLRDRVTGTTRERRGGLLFVGPARHRVSLTRRAPVTLRLAPV